MAHGYLGDGYGTHGERDPDRGDDHGARRREDNWRGERGEWRDRDRNRDDDRAMMFGERRHWGEHEGADEGRWRGGGSASRSYGREHGYGGFQGDYEGRHNQGGFGGSGDYLQGRRSYSANPDDHYRSWRDRHMGEVDRDYEDYCREREQQFHQDFDEWRRNRQNRNPRGDEIAQETELELTHQRAFAEEGNTPSPVGEATLGTNNSENTTIGRARPKR